MNSTDAEAIEAAVDAVRAAAEEHTERHGPQPIAVLDVDHVLYDDAPRIVALLQEWAESAAAHDAPTEVKEAFRRMVDDDVRFGLANTYGALGLSREGEDAERAYRSAKAYIRENLNSHSKVILDKPFPGAAAFVNDLINAGAIVVYLTGRIETDAGDATREAFDRDGFPVDGERAILVMKPDAVADVQFKDRALDRLAELGRVVVTADNEPANVALFHRRFPFAVNIFVGTRCSDNPAEPQDGVYQLSGLYG